MDLMNKRCGICITFLLLSTCVPIWPQAPAGQDSQSTPGLGSVADCNEAMLAPGEECSPNGQDRQNAQQPFITGTQGTGVTDASANRRRALAGPNGESVSPAVQDTARAGQFQNAPFPPFPPTEFQNFVAETTGERLAIYGDDLFRKVPSTFAPNDHAAVPQQYQIGPDDELLVHIWGQINYVGTLRVDRSGAIYLPQVGPVQVAGLPFSDLDPRLRAAIAKLYRNFDLSVDIGRIRSIQIYISGQARKPGAYTVSSLSTLVDALFATGGPTPQGSLRRILLNRDGKTIAEFDLYALLIHGDKSKDIHLSAEDVIYIPPAGPQVAITGSVRTPAIYETRSSETIGGVIEMAGGTTSGASDSRISVDRVVQHQSREALELAFDAPGLAAPATDGDLVRILSILPTYKKSVTLRGNLANPGRFSWKPGMRLSDLLPDRDSLVSRDYWWRRSHLGLPTPEFEAAVSPPSQLASPLAPTPLQRSNTQQGTNRTLASAQDTDQSQDGTQHTDQSQDGTQPSRRNDVRLIEPQINWNYAVIERTDPETLKSSLIPFNIGKLVLEHNPAENLELQPGDTVTVFSQSDLHLPIDEQVKYVELDGEFVRSGYYSVQPGETLRDLVRRAGGFTHKAYLYGSDLTRNSTRVLQQQRLNEYVRTVSLEAERGTQALAQTGSSSGSSMADAAASRDLTREMIDRLSQIKATGRIVLPFLPNSQSTDDVPALELENGDKFVVPFKPSIVNVVGAVYDQNSFVYRPGKTVSYYLQLAGGSNRNADWRHSFILRADGSVVSRNHLKGTSLFKGQFDTLEMNPGDTIVVPDKTLRPTALRGLIEWSQLFSSLALGAAAINVL
jgi:protein involved in polysaccharide export with SLBB domain